MKRHIWQGMSLELRALQYNLEFHKYPGSALTLAGGMIGGVWMLGNNYKGSGYYGSYPPNYLKRLDALFPDVREAKGKVMHLFSGSLPKGKYVRVDTVQAADVNLDAHELSHYWNPGSFDLIYADPPYSKSDASKYGTVMVNRKKVLEECSAILKPGGFVVWLDTVWPMVAKTHLKLVGVIGILRSQNHRVRFVFIMQKPEAK